MVVHMGYYAQALKSANVEQASSTVAQASLPVLLAMAPQTRLPSNQDSQGWLSHLEPWVTQKTRRVHFYSDGLIGTNGRVSIGLPCFCYL